MNFAYTYIHRTKLKIYKSNDIFVTTNNYTHRSYLVGAFFCFVAKTTYDQRARLTHFGNLPICIRFSLKITFLNNFHLRIKLVYVAALYSLNVEVLRDYTCSRNHNGA